MVNINKIYNAQKSFVEKIIDDIRLNNFSWEVLQYINEKYAQIEIDHKPINNWTRDFYNEYMKDYMFTFDEIEIKYGFIKKYINVYNDKTKDWDMDETSYKMLQNASIYEKYNKKEEKCVPIYKVYA